MAIGTEKDFALGNGRLMQCAQDVLLSCTFETCMVFCTNAIPVNSFKESEREREREREREGTLLNLLCGMLVSFLKSSNAIYSRSMLANIVCKYLF